MKKDMFLPFFALILSVSSGCFPHKIIQNTETTEKISSFSSSSYEKEILNYLNELRGNPTGFYHKYVTGYIRENPKRFTSYYTNSLKNTLLKQSALPLFKESSKLESLSQKQLQYLVHHLKGQKLTHNQGKLSFSQRIENLKLNCVAENLYRASYIDPLKVVLDLLIDEGVPSLGHRENMLNPQYDIIHIQSGMAANRYVVTVMDFGCE